MLDFVYIMIDGAKKHGDENWLLPDSPTMSLNANCGSRFRHLAKEQAGETVDQDSGRKHTLHDACRSLMRYTRESRGIIHPDDPVADGWFSYKEQDLPKECSPWDNRTLGAEEAYTKKVDKATEERLNNFVRQGCGYQKSANELGEGCIDFDTYIKNQEKNP